MSYAFPEAGLAFLRDLAENNNKEWFQANKKRYERDLKGPARALVAAVNEELRSIAPTHVQEQPHKGLNRINRDIRFSKDKTPYNTKMWAGFSGPGPKGASAGYYFGWGVDHLGVGCGAWMPPKDRITALRAHIAEHHTEIAGILEDPDFAATFGAVKGEAYKRVPKPYPADHPAGELLKLKGLHVGCDLDATVLTTDQLVPAIAAHFRKLVPLVDFLDAGLAG